MKKRILIATGIFPPDIGGPAVYAQKLAEEFFSRGIRITVVTYGKNFDKNQKYRIIGISRKWPMGIRQFLYLIKILAAAINTDGILALDSLGAGLPAMLAGKILRKKLVIRIGGDFLWERYVEAGLGELTLAEFYSQKRYRAYPVLNFLTRFVVNRADCLAFNTQFQRDLFIRYYGIDPRRAVAVGNAFEKQEGSGTAYQENPRIILWAGRFIKLKNLEFLLRVFNRLLECDRDLILELIGDGPEKTKIAGLTLSLGLSERVQIMPNLKRDLLLKEMAKSYFGILPSLSDINPNVVLEYLSLNKPVVVTQETGVREQFPGLVYADPKSEDSFVAAASKLLDKKEYNNYQKFISGIKYRKTWGDVAQDFLNLFR